MKLLKIEYDSMHAHARDHVNYIYVEQYILPAGTAPG